jgi:hypothetical protein
MNTVQPMQLEPRKGGDVLPMQAALTPMAIVQLAVDKNFDLARIETLMAIAERFEKKQAERAFHEAIAAFKKSPPKVIMDKHNKQYGSMYTSLGGLVNPVNAALGEHGLEAAWTIDQSLAGIIKVTCILTHALGHSREVSMQSPPDKAGAKNPIQEIKSAITYLKASTFEAVTGVASQNKAVNPDDDGNGASGAIDAAQVAFIKKLIADTKANEKALLDYFKAVSIEEIRASQYAKVVAKLETKKRQSK